MARAHQFEHLSLVLRERGSARFPSGGEANPLTKAAAQDRPAHVSALEAPARRIGRGWRTRQARREEEGLPVLPSGVPLLLKIDSALDVDQLRHVFDFELVSEEEDGFVIVASADVALTQFFQKLQDFAGGVRGSANVASLHELRADLNQSERLERILSATLLAEWARVGDEDDYIVDVSVSCTGTWQVPKEPKRGKQKEATWKRKHDAWEETRQNAYERWDAVKDERLEQVATLVKFYEGTVLAIIDGAVEVPASLPDSFTVRVELNGKGLKDLILNCAYVFEVVEPDHMETPQKAARLQALAIQQVSLVPPGARAPAVCVIDSGIQEGHFWLQAAMDSTASRCFLPGRESEVADQVPNGGHGTRVAGAVLFGETIPVSGRVTLETWLQNARVMDADGSMPREMLPPLVLRQVILRYHEGSRRTRIFNHSINSSGPCRTRHMSAWAVEIDRLCAKHDVLVIQSAGNLQGTLDQLVEAGRTYPAFLDRRTCRIANPAQSLQALTVGSVAYGAFDNGGWRSFATRAGDPSAFSRSGLGLWESIKPEVVEHGGDRLVSGRVPPVVGTPAVGRDQYPELLRTTTSGGPAFARDQVGTSFAAPKVSRIAARLQATLPDQSCLLYRALIVQSARWPDWADALPREQQTALLRRIGYGIPDIERATTNSDHRTTFITDEVQELAPGSCDVLQVRVPPELSRPGEEYEVRIDVTLSYVAEPRRTRRGRRGYLSVWADWISSGMGETADVFLTRALKTDSDAQDRGANIPWTIGRQTGHGRLRDVSRSGGTVQKDWVVLKSHQLPRDFCIAVRGHRGWSHDPEAAARYCLAVSFDVIGKEIAIYDPLRVAVEELRSEVGEIEAEATVEIEE